MNELTRRGEWAHISPTCLRELSGPANATGEASALTSPPMVLARPVRTQYSPDHQIIIVIISKRKLFLNFVSEKEKSSQRKIKSFPTHRYWVRFDFWPVGSRGFNGADEKWRRWRVTVKGFRRVARHGEHDKIANVSHDKTMLLDACHYLIDLMNWCHGCSVCLFSLSLSPFFYDPRVWIKIRINPRWILPSTCFSQSLQRVSVYKPLPCGQTSMVQSAFEKSWKASSFFLHLRPRTPRKKIKYYREKEAEQRRRREWRKMKSQVEMPPGFRFHPTDDELVNHYLIRRCAAQSIAVPIIAEIDLYKFDPWQLPGA